MAMQSICPQYQVEDPKTDYKGARRVGRIRMSNRAFYFPGFPGTQYLPFDAIRRIWAQDSNISTNGSCGAVLPVVVIRALYEGGLYQNFTFEKREETDEVLARLKELRPEIPQEPESK